jgi:hypothetical protein
MRHQLCCNIETYNSGEIRKIFLKDLNLSLERILRDGARGSTSTLAIPDFQ